MQWADDSLLDFIDYLLEFTRSSPMYVVTLARPELLDKRPTWGAGRRNFTSIHLEPLSEKAMQDLLAGLVPGLPEEVRTQILARAEGIPLYAVETVRMLLDRGELVLDGPVYRPTGTITALEVPETLHALIAARLDGLTPEERRLLQDASVLGKAFSKRALGALSGLPEAELDTLLGSLVRKEVLGVQADPRSPEHGQHSFLQDLVRHVAYETLSRRERRARHLAAAAHLQEAFPEEEEIVEVLASHYLDAYSAVPDAEDAAEIEAKARAMLVRAGERAASLAAAREAQRYFEQASELTPDQIIRADLQVRAGLMALKRARPEEARELLERAQSAFEAAGDVHRSARVSARLGEIDFREGHPAEAVARLERALPELIADEPDEDVAAVAGQLGRFLVLNGQNEEAAPHLERALELAQALALPEVFVESLTSKGTLLLRQDRLEEARIALEAAHAYATEHDLSASALRAANNLCVVYESSDRYVDTTALTAATVQVARRVGDRRWELMMLAGPIVSLGLLGRWDQAAADAEEVDSLPGGVGEQVRNQTIFLVSIDCWRGKPVEARARLEPLDALQNSEDMQTRGGYLLHEAMVLRTEGKPREALERLDEVLTQREALGTTYLMIKLTLIEALESAFDLGDTARLDETLGIIDALLPGQRGQLLTAHAARFRARTTTSVPDAEGGFAQAEKLFRELGLIYWLAVTQLEHAERLVDHGRASEAAPLIREARETFEQLEAGAWLDRLGVIEGEQSTTAPLVEPTPA
jgi:tetratricopeptide (TPR) repeat protein